ncbi:MAG: hypothetical protein IT435_07100 [Phycisphaerales bacterium]|nr:hypothetical protein [Phycisphaerales bacterium]
MPAGRPNRPLFDLIPEHAAEARRRDTELDLPPAPAVEIKPSPRASLRTDHSPAGAVAMHTDSRTAPRGFWGSLISSGRAVIEINTPWFAACIAVLLAGLLGVWVIAYKMGEAEATQRLAGGIGTAPPSRTLPSGSNAGSQDPAVQPSNQPSNTPTTPTTPISTDQLASNDPIDPTPGEPAGLLPGANRNDSGPVVAYNGSFDADPRTNTQNHLVLASGMSRQDARDAVDFLGRNGFAALGVPYPTVDRSRRDGKNDPLYKLVSAQGYGSNDMKETQRQRDKLADEARRLGLLYQRQHRGKYNFEKVYWEKYVR